MLFSSTLFPYDPRDIRHPGNSTFRDFTRSDNLRQQRRVTRNNIPVKRKATMGEYESERTSGRLCVDMDNLEGHVTSIHALNSSGRLCAVCGQKAYTACGECGAALHTSYKRKHSTCFLCHHSNSWFGLTKCNAKRFMRRPHKWCMPTAADVANNKTHINTIQEYTQPTDNDSDTTSTDDTTQTP